MALEVKVRVSKGGTIYIPRKIARAIGIKEGSIIKLRVEEDRVIIEPIPDPFELALNAPKYMETSFREFEEESERMQRELFGEET